MAPIQARLLADHIIQGLQDLIIGLKVRKSGVRIQRVVLKGVRVRSSGSGIRVSVIQFEER
jgi:hypothetical protein